MNYKDYISIGIPIYNAEKYLALAIQSIINQTHENWELILIDDGSTDNSLQIAKKFAADDKRIRVLSDGKNMKLPYRLNQIINEAKFEYIARMDADDAIHPDKLRIQLDFLKKHPHIDLVSTGLISIDDENKVYGYRYSETLFHDFKKVSYSYPIAHATILTKKSWYLRNQYNTNYSRAEDYALWCKASLNKDLRVATIPDLLYFYREEGNINLEKMINSYTDHYSIYKRYTSKLSFSQYVTMLLKKNIVRLLDKLGYLQQLAHRRNTQRMDINIFSIYQEILDNLQKSMKNNTELK